MPDSCFSCLFRAAVLEADTHTLGDLHLRHRRSAPQLKALPLAEEDADSRANLSELLARLISSRKGVLVSVKDVDLGSILSMPAAINDICV